MKRPYEKPTLTDLSLPTARAGWLSKGDSPQALCGGGTGAGTPPDYSCNVGSVPGQASHCSSGTTPQNFCGGGGGA
jgi:hypothetical protein